ncbi:MAG: hypothetical protein ABIJ16_07990, partial [Bacteroidota bacterium]
MKNKKSLFLTFSAILLLTLSGFGQCDITASGNPLEICVGDCVTLTSSGGCPTYLMYNDFNNQTIGTGWSSNAQPSFNNPCGSFGSDGTPYCWVGDAATNPRNLTTVAYAVTSDCQICFDFRMSIQADASPCEGPDEMDEGVSLQYSTNGGLTWIDITYFCPDGNQYPSNAWVGSSSAGGGSGTPFNTWANYCFNVPPGAAGPNTMFQWHQDMVTDVTFDHWGVDNVFIFCPPPSQTVTWYENPGTTGGTGGPIIYNDFNPPQQCPTTTTTYTVVLTDGTDTDSEDITVVVYGPPTLTFTLPATFCSNDPAYNLVGNPAGGTFSGTGVTGSSFNPGGVATGTPIDITYTYNTWNAGGTAILCTHTVTNSTLVNPVPTCSISANDVCVTSNSTVSYTGNAGAGATYSWNWGGGSAVSGSGAGPYQISWPNAGTFTISVTVTENGCSSSCTEDVDVWAAGSPNCCTMPTPNAGPDNAICGLNYTLQGIASVGTGTWTSSGPGTASFGNANSATSTVTVSTFGTYTFTWTEDNGGVCVANDAVTITFNATAPANAGADQTICGGGSATLTASGGTSYQWSNGGGTASITVSPVATTNYIVTVDDGTGCPGTDTATVFVNAQPNANAGTGGSYCSDTYTFNAIASVGTGTWTYTGPGTASFSNVNSPNSNVTVSTWGTYTFTWTENNNGCIDSDDVTVTFNYTPTSTFTALPASICLGDNVTVSYTGTGSGAAIFNWNWGTATANPGTGAGPHTVTFPTAGTHNISLSVTEAGCTSPITTVPVTVNPIPTSTFTINQPDCFGDEAVLTYTGNATGAATYTWGFGGGSGNPGSGAGPQYVSYAAAGTYQVTLEVTENGCTSLQTQQQVTVPTQMTASIAGTDILCHGELNGQADLTAGGGTIPYTYLWSNGSTNEDLTNVAANTYGVVVTDANMCTVSAYVTITEPPALIIVAPDDKYICNGQIANLTATASGGTGTLTYYWNGVPGTATYSVSPSSQTTYSVYVIDQNGCQSATESVTVNVSPNVVLELFANETYVCPGDPAVISANIYNGVPPYYVYNSYGDVISPPVIINPYQDTSITLFVEDQCGSIATDDINIGVYPLPPVSFAADNYQGCVPFTVNFNENSPD